MGWTEYNVSFNGTSYIMKIRVIDLDSDNDGYPDTIDDFPFDPTEWLDTDGDEIGNNADLDDDGDGYNDTVEISEGSDPLNFTSIPLDTDGDLDPDSTDTEDGGDGYNDTDDAFTILMLIHSFTCHVSRDGSILQLTEQELSIQRELEDI